MKQETIKRIAIIPTARQVEWLESQREKTGNSVASIIRGLVQDAINKSGDQSKG